MPSKLTSEWPSGLIRRASVNSFGYGGSNAHAIVEHPNVLLSNYDQPGTTSYVSEVEDIFAEEPADTHKSLLVFSANDEISLKSYVRELIRHLSNPAVRVNAADLAYTLSQRRTQHFYRAFVISDGPNFKENQVVYGKFRGEPRVSFVFTGQGAQWPQMGKELIAQFPVARQTVERLDDVLQSIAEPPSWSLLSELTEPRSPEHMRLPQFSQPLVTALQLALMSVLEDWGVIPAAVVGHSSGEIAAAVAAGRLSEGDAIKVAYLRGKASEDLRASQQTELGMLAVGLGESDARSYMKHCPRVQIACSNSPNSVTLSGETKDLEHLLGVIKADGHLARLLQVDLAYHSDYMKDIAQHYRNLLEENCPNVSSPQTSNNARFLSTVDGGFRQEGTDVEYWVRNMSSPVLFNQATSSLIQGSGVDLFIELGPSGALAGPINQIKQSLALDGAAISADYLAAFKRGEESTRPLHELAGKLFFWGILVDPMKMGVHHAEPKPRIIIDLPNYQWNHSVKYWHESLSSKDWRYRPFPAHDLLGTKVLGTSWKEPTFRRTLRLKDVPWIRDHTIGTDILFPASGYIAMAVEAMFQRARALPMVPFSEIENVSEASYRLRDIRLLRALVVEESTDHNVYLFLSPADGQKDSWFRFMISSLKDDVWSEHCSGLVRIIPAVEIIAKDQSGLQPLRCHSSAKLWYKSMQNVGFNFGPSFQNLVDIESLAGKRTSRARISMQGPDLQKKGSKYAIHPSVFDSFFQSGIPSLYEGHRTLIGSALVPRLIDEIVINPRKMLSDSAIAATSSVYVTGRRDKTQNYKSNATILDEQSANVISEIRGLHYTELDIAETGEKSKHFMTTKWNADISFLDDHSDLQRIGLEDEDTVILSDGLLIPPLAATLVSLLRHKFALPSFLDVDMTSGLQQPPGGEGNALASRFSLLRHYVFASTSPDHLLSAQKRLQGISNAQFHIYDPTSALLQSLVGTNGFDLALVRMPADGSTELRSTLANVRNTLKHSGFLILIAPGSWSDDTESSGSEAAVNISRKDAEPESLLKSTGFSVKARFPSREPIGLADFSTIFLCAAESPQTMSTSSLAFPIIDLSKGSSDDCVSLIRSMKDRGWTGRALETSNAALQLADTPLLILDNPKKPFLANVSGTDWDDIQSLLKAGRKILWVTSGSQMSVSSPSNALVHGFARCLRGEDPTLSFTTLDLSSLVDNSAARLTLEVMSTITKCDAENPRPFENEYCERNGVLHVCRIVSSGRLIKPGDTTNGELENLWLRKNDKVIRLWCDRLGAMNSVHFNEIVDESECLDDGEIEVEVCAAGVNFKDIMTSLGIVPEDEHRLGHEGAGLITRMGRGVASFRVGDRVAFYARGAFANRIRVPKEAAFSIPDSLSFAQAATMSVVYFTAVYSLIEIARVKKGQSVLIHSAAGGVGLASIQVCRYLGAEIYATAGSPEKRRFLTEQYGIPHERSFSSRNIDFAAGIRSLSGGRGVDFILNSLTGELLDESWRLLADNGILLEIGKRDMLDRNSLAMEPFDRNCSYSGIDISRPSICGDLSLVERVFQRVKALLMSSHIQPISPMTVFPFNEIPDAMRYMRSGEHIGKIVISYGKEDDVVVPVRRAPNPITFDPSATYLIVGGLKGLCGSLATYMARCGAKSLTIMSRSGADDETSLRVIEDLKSLGTKTKIVCGDITDPEDVNNVFIGSGLPIKGVIQGAMLLRDKTFESMTQQGFKEALACKLDGTWNLHHAAERTGSKLDFFTMLSSISAIVGTSGQANYASGCAFQDAFALYRQSLGLAVHTINLGVVEDVGYLSNHQETSDRVQRRSGLTGIDEKTLHEILRLSILKQVNDGHDLSAAQMITGLPYPLAESSILAKDSRFQSLLVPQSLYENVGIKGGDIDDVFAFRTMVKASEPTERLVSEAVRLVNKQIILALGLTSEVEESKLL
ncbi:hypothetical protein diail_6766, partial [Diaporthe ilicicola]